MADTAFFSRKGGGHKEAILGEQAKPSFFGLGNFTTIIPIFGRWDASLILLKMPRIILDDFADLLSHIG